MKGSYLRRDFGQEDEPEGSAGLSVGRHHPGGPSSIVPRKKNGTDSRSRRRCTRRKGEEIGRTDGLGGVPEIFGHEMAAFFMGRRIHMRRGWIGRMEVPSPNIQQCSAGSHAQRPPSADRKPRRCLSGRFVGGSALGQLQPSSKLHNN